MTSKYVLSIDQGTTGTTVLVLDHGGSVVSRGYSEFTQHYPKPGWVEHDAEEIWDVTRRVMDEALQGASISAAEVAALGITNQRETTVLWDRETGRPVAPAIVWQCRRTAGLCKELEARGLAATFREKTGLVLDAYFSGTKVQWLLDQDPAVAARARAGDVLFGTIDSWLLFKLTGGRVHATDYTNASRTLLYDIHRKQWDPELLEVLGVPPAMLPEVRSSSGVFGETAPDVLGGARVPVAGIAGDQQAALYGQGCWEPGMLKQTYGTGCFLLMNMGQNDTLSSNGLITTLCCDARGGPAYCLEGSIFIAGAAIQWLRDGLGLLEEARESEALARSVEDTAGVYFVPAFVGLGAPYWDMDARGAILGLTRGAGRAHVVRAALEAIAYQTRDLVEAMKADSGVPVKELRVDGGASANDFLMQFQADLLDTPVDRPTQVETTALGSAYLAGLAVEFWKDPAELSSVRQRARLFTPAMDEAEREGLYRGWKSAVARTRS